MKNLSVAVIGAGPYGMSVGAHLRAAGIDATVFGSPMEFWARHMPRGMRLRSSWSASHISDPGKRLTLDCFELVVGRTLERPLPLEDFLAYGEWFRNQACINSDPRKVTAIQKHENQGFLVQLEDGETLEAAYVLMATGIGKFAHRPPEFWNLPRSLASHASDHFDLSCFTGRKVMVVGAGQSAIETAALLNEGGAEVEVVIRTTGINWLTRSSLLHRLPSKAKKFLYHPTDVGPAALSHLVARPDLFRLLPLSLQHSLGYRCIRPAASAWLRPKLTGLRISTEKTVAEAWPTSDRLRIRLSDETIRDVDHLMFATGYRVDISRSGLFPPELLTQIKQSEGYPLLSRGMRSSVPGLHFLGATAAYSYGPLMRFVSGAEFASRSVTGFLAHALLARSQSRGLYGRPYQDFAVNESQRAQT